MTDDDVDITGMSGLRRSLGNLLDDFGTADSPLAGLLINGGLAGFGLTAWYIADGAVSAVGLAWALIHILAIVKWMVEAW